MGDVYRRSGRGGAGNFYSQKDVAEIEKRAAAESKNDLEAQKSSNYDYDEPPSDPADPPRTAAPTTEAYARSGRGGAGNFVDASTAVPVAAATVAPTPIGTAAAAAATTPRAAGLSGRGGAGNWATTTATVAGDTSNSDNSSSGGGYWNGWSTGGGGGSGKEDAQARERERERKDALDRSILRDMQDSLPRPPERTYHLHGGGGSGGGGRPGAGRGRVRGGELEDI